MGGGRKNPEKETSFKRSDSFKRISIRKNYLDRGAKKKQKNELANAQLFQEESKLEEYHITPSNLNKKKSGKESKVENIYMKAPQFMLRPVNDYEKLKEEFSERSSLAKNTRSREVCTQTDDFSGDLASSREEDILVNSDFTCSLFNQDITSEETLIDLHLQNTVPHNKETTSPKPVTSKKKSSCDNSISYKKYFNFTSNKTPEKIIIHVPASEDLTMPKSVSTTTHAHPSIPGFRTEKALSAFQSDDESHSFLIFPEREAPTKRDDSDDSAVEIYPTKDSVEILKFDRSPVFSPRQNFHLASPPPSLIPETNFDSVRNEEMRSLSVSLGRIWMDAPLAASAGSPPPPHSPAPGEPRAAHNSLDSALKSNKEDPVVVSGLHKNKSNKTGITDMFSSKDSGFSFSLSSHKLTELSPEYDRPNFAGGFFRSKKHLSGEVEGAPEKGRGSYRRISFKCKKGIRNSSKRKKQKKSKNDIYTVVIRRPPRSATSMKLLDPLIFVPPEKRTSSVRRNKCYKYGDEIRICPIPDSTVSYETEVETDEDLYEYISADLTEDTLRFSSSDEGSSPREMARATRDKAFSKKASKDRSAELSDSSRERLPYVPAGVSPVPARRPARRRPSRLARRKSSKGGKSNVFFTTPGNCFYFHPLILTFPPELIM